MMTQKEIKEWIKFAKKQGLQEFSVTEDGISFKFTEAPKAPIHKSSKAAVDKVTDPALLKDDPEAKMPSDSDLLFWSSEAYDSIEASKKDHDPR